MMNVGGRECVKGFDWSAYQPVVDLAPAKQAGYEFAVVKATEGGAYRDAAYSAHFAQADAAGLTVGSYHFARPDLGSGTAYADGQHEAAFVLDTLDARCAFVVLDLEATVVDAERTTEYAVGFFDTVDASGRFPARDHKLLYVGYYFAWQHCAALAGRVRLWEPWYWDYARDPDPTTLRLPPWCSDLWPDGWSMWQYSDNGTVAGVRPSDVDVATTDWLQAVRGGPSQPQPFAHQEDTMARCTYRFPPGSSDDWPLIDLRNGAYVSNGAVHYGPHWYHTRDGAEIFCLHANGEVNGAWVQTFATGNDGLDALYERWPKVFAS